MPKSFIPAGDIAQLGAADRDAAGRAARRHHARVGRAYQIIKKYPEVANVVESIGGGDGGEVRNATLYVSLVPRKQRELSQQQWERKVLAELKQIPDARINFQNTQGASAGARPHVLSSRATTRRSWKRPRRRSIAEMQKMPELREPRINGDLQRPEIIIHPRFDLAAQLGVTVQSISQTVRIATLGDIPQNAAKFSLSDRQVPIRVSLLEDARRICRRSRICRCPPRRAARCR